MGIDVSLDDIKKLTPRFTVSLHMQAGRQTHLSHRVLGGHSDFPPVRQQLLSYAAIYIIYIYIENGKINS